MRSEVLTGLAGGLLVGFAVGLLWGQSTRKNAAKNITTDIHSGVITVKVDAGQAMRQGLFGLLE